MKRSLLLLFLVSLSACGDSSVTPHEDKEVCCCDSLKSRLQGTARAESCYSTKVLEGIEVTIDGTDYKTITDPKGRWKFDALPLGKYDLTFRYPGYFTDHVMGVEIDSFEREARAPEAVLTRVGLDSIVSLRFEYRSTTVWVTDTTPPPPPPPVDTTSACPDVRVPIVVRRMKEELRDSALVRIIARLASGRNGGYVNVDVLYPDATSLTTTADVEAGEAWVTEIDLLKWHEKYAGRELTLSFTVQDCEPTFWMDRNGTYVTRFNHHPSTQYRILIP